ncbi:MAG TPA: CHRD domain-containing protein [Opitutaceae bacterium]|jgi:hypothetical protein|nr:CHRD domain-containing protein [Opitutaceae bacterium]
MKSIHLVGGIIAVALLAAGCSKQSATSQQPDFVAHLTGGEQVPAVTTDATGTASFWLNPDHTELRYELSVTNLNDVTMAHLHLGAAGENGPPVVWLYPSSPPPKEIPGATNGVLSQGSIKADNLVGPLAGKSVNDLVDAIKANKIYVNVHTTAHPEGEIRGQVQ